MKRRAFILALGGGGHAPYAAYYEEQLPKARAIVARLRGQ